MPKPTSHQRRRVCRESPLDTSAVSARIPPSPRLSARMISVTYLSVTTITSDQKMIERMPSTFSGASESWCVPVKHCRSV